jgi:glutamate synthase domain-containing protein 3
MINVAGILETIKSLIEGERRYVLLVMLFSGTAIAYIYRDNQELNLKLNEHEKNCQSILTKSKEYYEEQLRINRESSQKQITLFIEKSNYERDSIYSYFYQEIRKSNKIVTKSMNNLKTLTDENNN